MAKLMGEASFSRSEEGGSLSPHSHFTFKGEKLPTQQGKAVGSWGLSGPVATATRFNSSFWYRNCLDLQLGLEEVEG